MATGGSYDLSNKNIVQLAAAVAAKDMRTIAEGYLDITPETVKNTEDENKGDAQAFNRDILRYWKNRNSGPDQVKALAILLFKAAREGGYVDVKKVEGILGVTEQEISAGAADEAESIEDFSPLIEALKEYTKDNMKIEIPTLDESSAVSMDELYTDLTVHRIENKPTGSQSAQLDSYKDLFTDEKTKDTQQHSEPIKDFSKKRVLPLSNKKKILMKGESGVGKSTLGKKIAYDWAKGVFTAVSVVFFVSMKLIRPGQSIENIIIDQTPVIEGLGIDEKKLERFFQVFADKCLIIFDGLDEHELGSNDDVRKVIEGRKLLSSSIVLTSRPHSKEKIARYFPIVVRVDGFSKDCAEKFVTKHVQYSGRAKEFIGVHKNRFTFALIDSFYFSPMFLSFMCILMSTEEWGFTRILIEKAEMYYKLVRVLYERYCDRKDMSTFDETEFVKFLKRTGAIAWEMLKNGKHWVRRSEVIKVVGEDAFHYGLFIGSGIFGLSKRDAPITFFHESVKDFLGAYCFIQMLEDGQSVDSLLESDFERDLLLTNAHFFTFCLWLLSDNCRNEYFEFSHRKKIYDALVSTVAERINIVQMDMGDLVSIFPILRIPFTNSEENMATLKFTSRVLSECDKAQEFHFNSLSFYPTDILCQLLQFFPPNSSEQKVEKDFVILESATNHRAIEKTLNLCEEEKIKPTLLLRNGVNTDLSDCMHSSMRNLTLYDTQCVSTVSALKAMPWCPFLTELHLVNIYVGEGLPKALSMAVKSEKLPCLSHLNFAGCGYSLQGKLSTVFRSKWPILTSLNLDKCYLNITDIGTLTHCLSARRKRKLPKLTSLVLHLSKFPKTNNRNKALETFFRKALTCIETLILTELNEEHYEIVALAVNLGKLPNLRQLSITIEHDRNSDSTVADNDNDENDDDDENDYVDDDSTNAELTTLNFRPLTHLTLNRFITSPPHLLAAAVSAESSDVTELDISHSPGLTGNLSVLMSHSFPFLCTIHLSDCGLNPQDLKNLAKAKRQGRLPKLKHLDISHNEHIVGKLEHFLCSSEKWNELLTLNVKQDVESAEDFKGLVNTVGSGAFRELRELVLSTNGIGLYVPSCLSVKWRNLKLLDIHCAHRRRSNDPIKVFLKVLEGVEANRFPSLDTIHITLELISQNYPSFTLEGFLEGFGTNSKLYEHLEQVATASKSLLSTSLPSTGDRSYVKYILGLTMLPSVLKESPTEEYNVSNRFVSKLGLIVSDTCAVPDLKTICHVMHECIDMSPNIPDSSRPHAKYLGDVACRKAYSYLNAEPSDIPLLFTAVCDWVENRYDLSEQDLSALKSVLDGVQTMRNKPLDGIEQIRQTLEEWIQSTVNIDHCNRKPLISITKCVYTCVHSFFSGERLNLQPVSDLMGDVLHGDRSITNSERRNYATFIDVTCCLVESLANKPVSLKNVSSKVHEWTDNYSKQPPSFRYFLKMCVDVLCTGIECFFNKPFDVQPMTDLLQEWIDKLPNVSAKDRAIYKSLAEDSCQKLQSQINTYFNQSGMLPSSISPDDDPFQGVRENRFSEKADRDYTLTDIGTMVYKLRQRGIRVYIHHTTRDPQ